TKEKFKGAQEWTVPNREPINRLIAALPARSVAGVRDYLRGVFGDPSLDPGRLLWASETVEWAGDNRFVSRLGVWTTNEGVLLMTTPQPNFAECCPRRDTPLDTVFRAYEQARGLL